MRPEASPCNPERRGFSASGPTLIGNDPHGSQISSLTTASRRGGPPSRAPRDYCGCSGSDPVRRNASAVPSAQFTGSAAYIKINACATQRLSTTSIPGAMDDLNPAHFTALQPYLNPVRVKRGLREKVLDDASGLLACRLVLFENN